MSNQVEQPERAAARCPLGNRTSEKPRIRGDASVATGEPAATPGASNYTIQLSTNATFSSTLINTTVRPSTYTPATALPTNKVLRWRVRVNGAYGPGAWSEVRSLIIEP